MEMNIIKTNKTKHLSETIISALAASDQLGAEVLHFQSYTVILFL